MQQSTNEEILKPAPGLIPIPIIDQLKKVNDSPLKKFLKDLEDKKCQQTVTS